MKRTGLLFIALVTVFAWAACRKDNQSADNIQQEPTSGVTAKGEVDEDEEPGPDPETIAPCCITQPASVTRDPGFLSIVPANLYSIPNQQPSPCNNLRPSTHATHNVNWFASPYTNANGIMYNTPQVPVNNCNALQLVAGACDNGSISFWGNQITGESITQNGLQLTMNHQYKIKFNARVRPGSVDTAYIAMRFSNQVPAGSTDVRVIPAGSTLAFGNNSAAVRSAPILSTSWECYTMPVPLTANLSYNTLHVYPVNKLTANLSWAVVEIDNIQVY